MNIDDLAARLNHTIQSLADVCGSSRATFNSWRAPRSKPYAAEPRPETMEKMANSLDDYSAEVKRVARELRAEAVERRTKRA